MKSTNKTIIHYGLYLNTAKCGTVTNKILYDKSKFIIHKNACKKCLKKLGVNDNGKID